MALPGMAAASEKRSVVEPLQLATDNLTRAINGELVQQARLSHTRLGSDVDDTELGTCLGESALQRFQFVFTPDKGAETTAHRTA
jgi:hypothetical protein